MSLFKSRTTDMSDGSNNIDDGLGWVGLKVYAPDAGLTSGTITVTGVSSCWTLGDRLLRLLLARDIHVIPDKLTLQMIK